MIITISRQTGSQGKEITDLLARKLKLPIIDRDMVMERWMPEVANRHELHMLRESPAFFLSLSSQGISFAEFLEKKLRELAEEQSIIIFGLGAQVIFANYPEAFHIKIMASTEVRINRVIKSHHTDIKAAERFLDLTDRKHKRYISTIYGKDWSDPELYHLTLNTNNLSIEEAADFLSYAVQNRKAISSENYEGDKKSSQPIVFMHPSEEEFASILNMHNIEWEYEPRTFPIEWDVEGNVTQAFAPDFYLPRFDTYIELTTMEQKYVAQKKKKVQKLKKLYPGTNINIVYKKDFYTLAKRFGLGEVNNKK